MVEYSDTKLQEIIDIAQESLYNGKILTVLNELEKSFPEIVKEYSITTNKKNNPESIEELTYKKNTIKDIIFYSKIKIYENSITQNTTKEKEEIYLQNTYEGLLAYTKIQDNMIAMINLFFSRIDFETKYGGIYTLMKMNGEKLDYFNKTFKIFDNKNIQRASKLAGYDECKKVKQKFLDQSKYVRNKIKVIEKKVTEETKLLNNTKIIKNSITIPIIDSEVTFEYTLN
ncbi:MAG: hypothetical protein ACP5N1_02955 [Candidatus Woesearchaeota archaeon]